MLIISTLADNHLGGKVPTIANERHRFNSLYSTEPEVIVIIRNEVEVYARMDVL